MRTPAYILFLCTLLIMPIQAQVQFGKPQLINQDWKFQQSDNQAAKETTLNDHNWQKINLPHDWSVKGQLNAYLASCTGYLPGGVAWYRKNLTISPTEKGKKTYLYFEGIYNRSEVYLNGHLLGKRPNGYISFLYDATPYIDFESDNVIAVRVDHSQSADSRWYTGSGIYRNAWLIYADPIHIAQWGLYAYPEKTKSGHQLQIELTLDNNTPENTKLTVVNELLSPNGEQIAKTSQKVTVTAEKKETIQNTIKVRKPVLWSLTTPNLYTLRTSIYKAEELIDSTSIRTGFRNFTFDPNKGFALNGQWMKVKGVCLHHDAGVLGAAVPREVWKRRLLTLKEVGVNAIRTSHNPQAPDLYDLCDELGLLVMNEAFDEWEFPKRKWLQGWNVGTPGFQGAFDFFEEWGERDLADLVCRDRNHLSIFAWSIGNEVDYPNDPYSHPVLEGGGDTGFTQPIFGGFKKDAPDAMRLGDIAQQLAATVRKHDRSRPVTAGLAGVAMSNQTAYPHALDIAGYNYTESMYDNDHQKYPERVIYGSENRHDLKAWKDVTERDFIFGQFLWTGIDYLGESGRWPSRGFYSGLLDFGGFIKPRGYFRQSLWSEKPMAYLGTYPAPSAGSKSQMKDVWSQLEAEKAGNYQEQVPSMDAWSIWNYTEGQLIRVVCYTNTAKAELLLDGKSIGERKDYPNDTGIIHWDIPFKAGKLEVIGFDSEGKEQARYAIQSSKEPYALQVIASDTQISPYGVAQVLIQVVDKEGVPVMLSDNEVSCQIVGPARLLGLEASNNSDMSDYTDAKHRVFHGRILAYLQAEGQAGKVHINFTSPWLKSAETTISVK